MYGLAGCVWVGGFVWGVSVEAPERTLLLLTGFVLVWCVALETPEQCTYTSYRLASSDVCQLSLFVASSALYVMAVLRCILFLEPVFLLFQQLILVNS